MLPAGSGLLDSVVEFAEPTSRTFALHIERDRIAGYTDGLDAIKQAVYLILSVERYEYIIYSWNYGVELLDLFGKPIPYVLPEIKRRITQALLQDTRITSVDDFSFETQRGRVAARFTVHSIFGDFEAERVVVV